MLSPSSVVRARGVPPRLRPVLLGQAAVLASFLSGLSVALLGWLSVAGLMGAVALAALAFAPSYLALGALLLVRGLTDAFSDAAIAAGLNAGSLIGLLFMAGAALVLLQRIFTREERGVGAGVLVLMAVGFWFLVGVMQYGAHESIVRELLRTLSLVAVALIAANADRSITPRRIADLVVLVALVPAAIVVIEGAMNWQAVVTADFRPRGSLSHPNAASILFSVAIPFAVWRWAYGGGGARYLLAAGFLAAAILVTKSMGGLAQVVVTLFVGSMLLPGHTRARLVLGVGAAAIVAVFVFDPFGLSRISELETATFDNAELDRHDNSFEWRLVNWGALMEEWREQPWVGRGLGTTTDLITPLGHEPHSDPVRFLVEGGVIGFWLVVVGATLVVSRLWRLAKAGPSPAFAVAVLAMLAGVFVHGLVTHVSLNTQPGYVIAAIVAWTLTLPVRAPATEASPAAPPPLAPYPAPTPPR